MSVENLFYQRLKREIISRHKSINQIERELGYPRNALSNYKNASEPSASRLVELADYFEVSPEYLLGKEEVRGRASLEEYFSRLSTEQKVKMFLLCKNWLGELD